MPTYVIRDKLTGKEEEKFMFISEMEELLETNPNIELLPAAPMIVSGVDSPRNHPNIDFNSRLKEIQKNHPLGNINTF